jgi:cytochrome b561
MAKPTGYTRTQIALHWIIFLLIACQFLLHEWIADAWDQVGKGMTPAFSPLVAAHVFGGILVFLLALWRISIKIKRGSPALPDNESRLQQIIAHATHGLLYLLMLLLPLSGMAAWFGGIGAAAEGHEIMTTVLLILVGLHFLGALYHRLILKSGVMERMLRPE